MLLELAFPNLANESFAITSQPDKRYNCIAWAAGVMDQWWWRDPFFQKYWPESVAREETMSAFADVFRQLGYEPCTDGVFEAGFEKIAIYGSSKPTHAARQLADGTWTSKLGQDCDISHDSTNGVSGVVYGDVALFMRRPRAANQLAST